MEDDLAAAYDRLYNKIEAGNKDRFAELMEIFDIVARRRGFADIDDMVASVGEAVVEGFNDVLGTGFCIVPKKPEMS